MFRKYLRSIGQFLAATGHDPSAVLQPARDNRDLKLAGRTDKEMTPEHRKFCEDLLARKHLRNRFLHTFATLRAEAQAILDGAKGRDLTPRERTEATMLGMVSCFAAIETAGAPTRISNVRPAPLHGPGAWITVPKKAKAPIKVFIPKAHTKSKKQDIRFDILPDAKGGYETIRWFVETIRPLIPGAESNLYLFPSPEASGAPVSDSWF
ncbi:hypothetical protein [Rhodobacter sp. NSM]|uniref:hypothetical protein n=1 Tax=Rhodobacter sp. NSM TaxID=3457501 RepID=UPI003FD5B403